MTQRTWYIVLLLTILLSLAIAAVFYRVHPDQSPRQQRAVSAPSASMPKAVVTAKPDLVLDLFAPTPAALDAQHRTTLLRTQLEQALSITFLLTHCQYLSEAEYGAFYNRFAQFAVKSGLSTDFAAAEQDLRSLADAAGASYALVYSRVPCDDPSLAQTLASLRQWEAQADAVATVNDSSSTP